MPFPSSVRHRPISMGFAWHGRRNGARVTPTRAGTAKSLPTRPSPFDSPHDLGTRDAIDAKMTAFTLVEVDGVDARLVAIHDH